MSQLFEDETPVDRRLVEQLIRDQCPEWAEMPVAAVNVWSPPCTR